MIPKFPEFSKLSADHKEEIEAYTRIFPPYSDYTFPSLWSWNIHERIELSALNGNLVVRFTDYVTNEKFLSFLGNKEVNQTVEALFALIENMPEHLGYLKLIPEHNLHGENLGKSFEIVEDPDNHDYVYRVEELASMKGAQHESTRNEINKFLRKNAAHVIMLDLSVSETWLEMGKLCRIWMAKKLQKGFNVLNDTSALSRLAQVSRVKLFGIGILVEEKVVAYGISEFNHGGYSTSLFEHADINFAGVFQFLRKQQALKFKTFGSEWFNHQQDLGIKGLRQSKRSYRPAFFLKKFIIRRAV